MDNAIDFGTEGNIAESELDSPTSFWINGPNPDSLIRNGQPDDEPTSSEDSVALSPRKEPRRWFTHKEKVKEKLPEYVINKKELDRSEFDSGKNKDRTS